MRVNSAPESRLARGHRDARQVIDRINRNRQLEASVSDARASSVRHRAVVRYGLEQVVELRGLDDIGLLREDLVH